MNVKIISCQVFEVYLNKILKTLNPQYQFDIEYFEIDQHNNPKQFNRILQNRITEITEFDLIILIYGICGNVTTNLKASSIPIIIPKVHDCSTILLGSKQRFREVFEHRPSQGWSCLSYGNDDSHSISSNTTSSYQELVSKYGEDNAQYLFDMLYPSNKTKLYISLGLEEDIYRISTLDSKTEIVVGSLQYLINILNLDFSDLLYLNPGEEIVPLYDHTHVLTKK